MDCPDKYNVKGGCSDLGYVVAEHYTFYEKDTIGMLEGSVHINEVKMNEDGIFSFVADLNDCVAVGLVHSFYKEVWNNNLITECSNNIV